MSSRDNQEKALHGWGARKSLANAIDDLKGHGAITEAIARPRYGYVDYSSNQFGGTEVVSLADGSKLLLFSTNSVRTDRVKEQQWDAFNIKAIDSTIESAWIVVPDEDARRGSESFIGRLRGGHFFTAIDDIVTVEEFYEKVMSRFGETMSIGSKNDMEGRSFEQLFATIMGTADNLRRFNGDDKVGYRFEVFEEVFRKLGVCPRDVTVVAASTDIPKLPSGGNPKTDVAATLAYGDMSTRLVTFSLKNSSRNVVSVHEYSADDFADVLDKNNPKLRKLLRAFQAVGSARDMMPEDRKSLTDELAPYREKLDLWVFGGLGARGVTEIQCAQYLVVHDKNSGEMRISGLEEYCASIEASNDSSSGFGTVFQWTYPSKQRGQKIQLKSRIDL